MTPHYILASNALIKKELVEAREWVYSNKILVCKELVEEAIAEYNMNRRGFTMTKHKATYPKR